MNIVFNLTFHQHINPLKFHLTNILNWNLMKNSQLVITSAHKDNLLEIENFIKLNFKNIKFHCVFVENDLGYHKGTFENVRSGIKFIDKNLEYDYIVNIEADNMFWYENKLLSIIKKMDELKKQFLFIPEGGPSNIFRNSWPDKIDRKYIHFTTLNVYSKDFIKKVMPLDVVDKYYNLGWCSQEGTPFEPYIALCIREKLSLSSLDLEYSYYKDNGLWLNYDYHKVYFDGWYFPDDLVPDKFIKWGILNCLSTAGGRHIRGPWEVVVPFIKMHEQFVTEEVLFNEV